jgi:hypothetical protein
MKAIYKGVAVACLHLMIVANVGGKFLYDRAHRPRVWVKTGSVDPDLPIRGRYMALRLEVQAPSLSQKKNPYSTWVALAVENGALVARESDVDTGLVVRTPPVNPSTRNQQSDVAFLDDSVLFFLPEHADFPRLKQGDELWAEVTVPKKGPPRPIQLALKRGTEWKPLSYR